MEVYYEILHNFDFQLSLKMKALTCTCDTSVFSVNTIMNVDAAVRTVNQSGLCTHTLQVIKNNISSPLTKES